MSIRALHGQTKRYPLPFGQQAALNTAFGTVGGVRSGVFAAQRGFGNRPIQAQPGPINALQSIKLLDAYLPQLEKHASLDPFLVTVMSGRARAQVGLVEGLPLTAGAQDVENRIRTLPVWYTWPSTTKPVRIHMDGQHWLQDRPEFIRNPKTGGGLVVGVSGPSSFGFISCFHAPYYTTSYSDRH